MIDKWQQQSTCCQGTNHTGLHQGSQGAKPKPFSTHYKWHNYQSNEKLLNC